MAKKKKSSPKSSQRVEQQRFDPLRAGRRALLPHHVPFVDWVETGRTSTAPDPRQAAERVAVTLALPIGVLLDGRSVSAPLSLTAADVAGLAVDLRQIAPTAVRDCLASVTLWVDFLVATGRWRGRADAAADVVQALDVELSGGLAFDDDDEEMSPPEVLREKVRGTPFRVFLDWAAESPLVRAADLLLARVDDGCVVTDMEGYLHPEEWPILTEGLELAFPGEFVEAVWRTLLDEGVLAEGDDGIVAAGPDVDAWRRPGRDRVSICLRMARSVLENLHRVMLLETRDDHDAPLALLMPIVVCLLGSEDLILPVDGLEEALSRALLNLVGSTHAGADVGAASSVISDLRALGMLEVEDATLVVSDPWLPALSRFVDAHETGTEPEILGDVEDHFHEWLEEPGRAAHPDTLAVERETFAALEETLVAARELDALIRPDRFSARALIRALPAVTHERAAAQQRDEREVLDEVIQCWWHYLQFLHDENRWRGDRAELRACVLVVRDLLPAELQAEVTSAQAEVEIDEADEATYLWSSLPVRAVRAMMEVLPDGAEISPSTYAEVARRVGRTSGRERAAAWYTATWVTLAHLELAVLAQDGARTVVQWPRGRELSLTQVRDLLPDYVAIAVSQWSPEFSTRRIVQALLSAQTMRNTITVVDVRASAEALLPKPTASKLQAADADVRRVLHRLVEDGVLEVADGDAEQWAVPRALRRALRFG